MNYSYYKANKQAFSPSVCLDGVWMIHADKNYMRSYDIPKSIQPNTEVSPKKEKDILVALRTTGGEGILKLKDKVFRLTKGTLIFFYINQPRYYRTDSEPWEFVWSEFMINYRFFELDTVFSVPYTEREESYFRQTIGQFNSAHSMTDNYISSLFATQLLTWMNSVLDADSKKDGYEMLIQKVLSMIALDYQNPALSCEQLAAAINLSERRFRTLFALVTDRTPKTYITEYRLRIARNLLRNTNLPVVQISAAVGFENQAYFSNAFKKHMHLSPTDYRNQNSSEIT